MVCTRAAWARPSPNSHAFILTRGEGPTSLRVTPKSAPLPLKWDSLWALVFSLYTFCISQNVFAANYPCGTLLICNRPYFLTCTEIISQLPCFSIRRPYWCVRGSHGNWCQYEDGPGRRQTGGCRSQAGAKMQMKRIGYLVNNSYDLIVVIRSDQLNST